jgi:hypothetical protein
MSCLLLSTYVPVAAYVDSVFVKTGACCCPTKLTDTINAGAHHLTDVLVATMRHCMRATGGVSWSQIKHHDRSVHPVSQATASQ